MENIGFQVEYMTGDYVYHLLEENKKGIVLDIRFSFNSKSVEYRVVFGMNPDNDVWCSGLELSIDPQFG